MNRENRYTVKELAEMYRVHPDTMRDRIRRGEFGVPEFDGYQYWIKESAIREHDKNIERFSPKMRMVRKKTRQIVPCSPSDRLTL